MTISSIYAGSDQADLAMLTVGNVTFWCFVWLAAGGLRVEAKIFAEGEDGQMVLIDAAVVATPGGDFLDCPRVNAIDGSDVMFVVHWIDASAENQALYRSLFNMADIAAGWSPQGSVTLHSSLLYDVAPVIGASDGDFVVTRRTASGTIATERYVAPWSWVDTAWTESETGLVVEDNVLACFAHEDDDVVLVGYQDTAEFRVLRRNASDGQDPAVEAVFLDLLDGSNNFTAAGFTRISAAECVLVVEAVPESASGDLQYARVVAWSRLESSSGAALGSAQWCWNVHMLSRPWSWASGVTGMTEAYVGASFKSIDDGQEYDQMFGYVLRLDIEATQAAEDSGVVRPIPCSAIMGGSVDARPHGMSPATGVTNVSIGCRMNHLSNVGGPPQYTLGPNLKSVMFASVCWSRLQQTQDTGRTELHPVQAGVARVRFHHEDPWTVRRYDPEPSQPDTTAWRGVTRTMARPVETPVGLVWTGGVTSVYDGQQPVEVGFLWAPEIMEVSVAGSGGTMDVAETYYWYVNYIWLDSRGQTHRSPPSRPQSGAVVVSGFVTLRVRCMNLTMKDDRERYPNASRVGIEVWRTCAPSGTFQTLGTGTGQTYLFRSEFGGTAAGWTVEDIPFSDPAEAYVDIVVGRANSVLQYNQLAPYQLNLTTLQWSPPPPIPHQPLNTATVWQDRLFGTDPEVGLLRWAEQFLPLGTQYVMPEFLDVNTFRLDTVGTVTALQPMDDILLVFTRDGVYALTGDPGAGGSGASLRLQHIAKDIGCIEPRSVVHYSEGVLFQSAKGIHRVTRGGGIDYPGAPIEDLVRAAGNVRSAVHLENRHQIRYTLQATPGTGPLEIRSRIVTFDYRVGLWSVRNLPALAQASTASRLNEMQHACAWRGRQGETLHVVLAQGGLAIERTDDDTVYADVGAAGTVSIPLDVTTEWIHVGGIAGLHRVKEIGIQTERVNAGPLTIELWFDVAGTWNSDRTRDQAYTYDGVANFAPAYIAIRPRYQKISGFKMRVYEPTSTPQTENVRLVSMTILWEPKPGMRKVARRALA